MLLCLNIQNALPKSKYLGCTLKCLKSDAFFLQVNTFLRDALGDIFQKKRCLYFLEPRAIPIITGVPRGRVVESARPCAAKNTEVY